MKKLNLLFVLIFTGTFVFAQNVQTIQELTGLDASVREVTDIVCPGNSLYSQTPDGLDAVATSGGGLMYDDILNTPTGPIQSITFWMLEGTSYNPLTVDIIFRHDDGGGLPGSVFASFYSVAVTGVNTGETSFGYPVMEYTYVFPAGVSVTTGDWVGIADYPDDFSNNHHYWVSSSDGNGSSIFSPDMIDFFGSDLAFCLEGTPQIPISNWAIFFGIFLIGLFVIFRFRRRLA